MAKLSTIKMEIEVQVMGDQSNCEALRILEKFFHVQNNKNKFLKAKTKSIKVKDIGIDPVRSELMKKCHFLKRIVREALKPHLDKSDYNLHVRYEQGSWKFHIGVKDKYGTITGYIDVNKMKICYYWAHVIRRWEVDLSEPDSIEKLGKILIKKIGEFKKK